ncbi:beta-lactamase family protein [Nocardioides carbamazepini]|uniref:serine hydrolase domain-containing protein n=1 Tax=Nocardioides carbamazepini TaxID=2854259 RepID=UPI00214A334B|nr:serine hydrolase domain-containing protein [Nocardioides carbamazepini]MCR1783827.1 beta-lactamase family protein [Nocardioides carbamazepini]
MEELSATLAQLTARWRVPGAAVAVVHRGRIIEAYAGRQSAAGRLVDAASVFEIGSITKSFTATLIMQLVDEGKVSLDAPVQHVLPEFALADPQLAARVTVRHLLTHAPGFDGDDFTHTGDDDESLRRYVARLALATSFAEPGTLFSYCNAGISVLGRIVEVLRGVPFDRALAAHLLEPLGLRDAYPDPAAAPADLVVTGHREPDGTAVQAGAIVRGLAPSGSKLTMTARDLATFGMLHLGGVADSDQSVLSPAGVAQMQAPQSVAVPFLGPKWGSSRGLGWDLYDVDGVCVVGHNGHTTGQVAALRVVPDRELVVAVLTNGGASYRLIDAVLAHVLGGLGGLRVPDPMELPQAIPVDASPYVGTYAGRAVRWTVEPGADGELGLSIHDVDGAGDPVGEGVRTALRKLRDHTFVGVDDDCGMYPVFTFLVDEAGRARFLHNSRAYPRR